MVYVDDVLGSGGEWEEEPYIGITPELFVRCRECEFPYCWAGAFGVGVEKDGGASKSRREGSGLRCMFITCAAMGVRGTDTVVGTREERLLRAAKPLFLCSCSQPSNFLISRSAG